MSHPCYLPLSPFWLPMFLLTWPRFSGRLSSFRLTNVLEDSIQGYISPLIDRVFWKKWTAKRPIYKNQLWLLLRRELEFLFLNKNKIKLNIEEHSLKCGHVVNKQLISLSSLHFRPRWSLCTFSLSCKKLIWNMIYNHSFKISSLK